jgi:hypothetical protein
LGTAGRLSREKEREGEREREREREREGVVGAALIWALLFG